MSSSADEPHSGVPVPVTLHDIVRAAARLAPYCRRTPLERSAPLSAAAGHEVYLKLETAQRTGSFKLRGALNALLALPADLRARGVVACSAGNHALGVAGAARLTASRATVVVPRTASPAKIAGLRASEVELLLLGANYDEAEVAARDLARERDLAFVSPYNDPAVIAGAGTVGLEVLLDLPDASALVVPVGGGGLVAGIGVAARAINPALRVIGAQPAAAPAMHAALAAGRLVPVTEEPTLADGLAGNIEAGSITFPLARQVLDDLVLVSEASIGAAMLALLDRHHLVVEGAGAVGLAALRAGLIAAPPGPLVLIVSGGNVASEVLGRLLRERD